VSSVSSGICTGMSFQGAGICGFEPCQQPLTCRVNKNNNNKNYYDYYAGAAQSADALRSVREAFEAQGKAKTEKKPAVKRHAAGQTWCAG